MSQEGGDTNRRKVLQGMTAAAVAPSATGVASAGEGDPIDDPLSTEEREQLVSAYATLDAARAALEHNTEALREELSDRGVLSTADASVLNVQSVVRHAPPEESLDEAYVDAVYDDDRDAGKVNVSTNVHEGGDREVQFGVEPATGNASAVVLKDGEGVESVLVEEDGVVEERVASMDGFTCLDERCDDCCGWWDCSASRKYEYAYQTGCGCLSGIGVNIPGKCCNASCSGFWPCSC